VPDTPTVVKPDDVELMAELVDLPQQQGQDHENHEFQEGSAEAIATTAKGTARGGGEQSRHLDGLGGWVCGGDAREEGKEEGGYRRPGGLGRMGCIREASFSVALVEVSGQKRARWKRRI
jgi:hypothetical protein